MIWGDISQKLTSQMEKYAVTIHPFVYESYFQSLQVILGNTEFVMRGASFSASIFNMKKVTMIISGFRMISLSHMPVTAAL